MTLTTVRILSAEDGAYLWAAASAVRTMEGARDITVGILRGTPIVNGEAALAELTATNLKLAALKAETRARLVEVCGRNRIVPRADMDITLDGGVYRLVYERLA